MCFSYIYCNVGKKKGTFRKNLEIICCFLGDMWPNHNGEEPDWVKNERSQFHEHRDRNGDGKMDKAEVKEWIIPPDYDHSEAEARHLIYETDGDKVGWQKKPIYSYSYFCGWEKRGACGLTCFVILHGGFVQIY